jgi:hypothetical protein
MGRQPNGPQGLGHDQKSLWALDFLALLNLLRRAKQDEIGHRLECFEIL